MHGPTEHDSVGSSGRERRAQLAESYEPFPAIETMSVKTGEVEQVASFGP
ncbi:MAG TPA: hypothetical protein VF895_03125 [Gaiellaceae bacterium]